MSDEQGNLLFYSNGCKIMNRQHELMENGDTISPGPEYAAYCTKDFYAYDDLQGMVALPYPGHPNQYIVFHGAGDSYAPPVYPKLIYYYSIIDMSLNNGLGKVIKKNQQIIGPEDLMLCVTAARHANGRDWWVIIPGRTNNIFYLFLVSPEGVKGPMVQNKQETWITGHTSSWAAAFSPDGSKYIRTTFSKPPRIVLFDFDRCTGTLQNPIVLNVPDTLESLYAAWPAFSPNNRYLYIQNLKKRLFQYDTWASDISTSVIKVGEYDGFLDSASFLYTTFHSLTNGPDGKIYMACGEGSRYLHIIHSPDSAGLKCDFRQHDLKLPTYFAFFMPSFPHYRLYDLSGSPCDTLNINGPSPTEEPSPPAYEGIALAPNPALGEVTLSLTDPEAALLRLRLIDVQGRVLSDVQYDRSAGERAGVLHLAGQPAGVYIVQVMTTKGWGARKIVKSEK